MEQFEIFLTEISIFLGVAIFVLILKALMPTVKGLWGFVLFILIVVTLYFAITAIIMIDDDKFSIFPVIFFVLCCVLLYHGGRGVAYLSTTAVFDRMTSKPIRGLKAGSRNWVIPIFEYTGTSTDGVENGSLSLKELKVKIIETPKIQTKTPGIQAVVRDVVFMLRGKEDQMQELLRINDGGKLVYERVVDYVYQFFHDKVGHTDPEELDTDKGTLIRKLANQLKVAVNRFCDANNYPYEIPKKSRVTIGDTELDEAYYQALAKKEIARLTNMALDLDAEKLLARLIKLGNDLLPDVPGGATYTPDQRLKAAQVSLKIVSETIEFKKFGLDADTAELAKAIAEILKKK